MILLRIATIIILPSLHWRDVVVITIKLTIYSAFQVIDLVADLHLSHWTPFGVSEFQILQYTR